MEQVDILNRFREQTRVTKGRKELVKGEYRISTHIWVMDSNGRILVLKRSEQEDKFPGMWAQVGGGVVAGDTSKETVIKECLEELGLTVKEENMYYVASYIRTRDIVDVWLVLQNVNVDELVLQEEEVADAKLVTLDEFDSMIDSGLVVPSINPSYYLMKNYVEQYMDK